MLQGSILTNVLVDTSGSSATTTTQAFYNALLALNSRVGVSGLGTANVTVGTLSSGSSVVITGGSGTTGDVDECAEGTDDCSSHADCTNTYGKA